MAPGTWLFEWINGLAGKFAPLDHLMRVFASDYFMIVLMCTVMMVMWFGTRDPQARAANQKAVICASISLGLSSLWVKLLNNISFWPRPFNAGIRDNLLFYRPPDPSFPSNTAAVVFAIATGIFLSNRKVGGALYFLAALMGFSRIWVGIHFPIDVAAGAAIGVVTGVVVYWLFQHSGPLPSALVWLGRRLYLM